MKYLLILLSAMAFFTQADKYYVIYAKGHIHVAGSGKMLKTGDELNAADKLIFDNPSSKLICVSAQKGRVELVPDSKKSPSGELWVAVRNGLPEVSHYRFSTRSVSFDGYDPAEYFQCGETDDRILLIKDQIIPLSPGYKLDSTDFFFVQYTRNGKAYTTKVTQAGMGISFDMETFSAASIDQLPPSVMLCYQSVETGTPRSRPVATFKPALIFKTELEQQIAVIKAHSKTVTKAAIETYLYDTYGKIGDAELNEFIK
jgi:hypothetical protein